MKKNCCFVFLLFLLVNSLFALDYPWQKKNAEEFINVETHFVFMDENGTNMKEMVCGSPDSVAGNYSIPNFSVGIPMKLMVQMHPTLKKNANGIISGVRDSEKSKKREITVEITIIKSRDIQIYQIGGVSKVESSGNIDGSLKYIFSIKNDEQNFPSILFQFVPAETGSAEITVKYYGDNENQKIVDRSCDVVQEVTFTR